MRIVPSVRRIRLDLVVGLTTLLSVGWVCESDASVVPSANTGRRFPALGNMVTSVAVADFNNDGAKDVVVSPLWNNELGKPLAVSLMLGDGMGGFGPPTAVSWSSPDSSAQSGAVAVGDINSDGNLDLAIAVTIPFGLDQVSFLLGDGRGGFSKSSSISPDNYAGASILLTDLNADGKLDIAGTATGAFVALGDGTGQFGAVSMFSAGSSPVTLTSGDVNVDGKPDLVVGNHTSKDISVLLGNGSGGFGAALTYQVPTPFANPTDVRIGDLTGDAKPDIGVVDTYGFLTIFAGNNSGQFPSPPTQKSAGGSRGAFTLDLFDLDADGKLDVLVKTLTTIMVLHGDGGGAFTVSGDFVAGPASTTKPGFADLNGDGRPDAIVPGSSSPSITVLLGQNAGFNSTLVVSPPPTQSNSQIYGIATGDVNADGMPDLATNVSGKTGIALGLAGGQFGSLTVSANCTAGSQGIALFDVNHDGKPDAVGGSGFCLGVGNGTFGATVSHGLNPTGPFAHGDFNGDGYVDLAGVWDGAAPGGDRVHVILGTAGGAFTAATPYLAGENPKQIVTGDFNQDGKLDLAVLNSANVAILLGNGNGTFAAPLSYGGGSQALNLAVGDVNEDGKPDLVVSDNFVNVNVLIGDGLGGFALPVTYSVSPTLQSPGVIAVALADWNGDGHLDALTWLRSSSEGVYVLLGNGLGAFASSVVLPTATTQAGQIQTFKITDLNADGRVDLLQDITWAVSTLMNTSGPQLSVSDVTLREGNSGTKTAQFTVSLDGVAAQAVTASYRAVGITAQTGSDFTSTTGTLSFAIGETSKTVVVPVLGDAVLEPDETFFVSIGNPVNAGIGKGYGLGIITNDDFGPPVVSSPTVSSIATTSVTLGANVTSDGGSTVTARGVVYSRSSVNASPTLGGSGVTTSTVSGTTGLFASGVTGLLAGTAYSFKGYATSAGGTAYTSVSTFTTLTAPPGSPTINSFTANNILVNPGGASTLSWSVSGGGTLTLNGSSVSGTSLVVNPSATTNYILTATNASGSATRALTIQVSDGTAGLGTPTVTAPTSGQTVVVTGVGFTWTGLGSASGYDIRVLDSTSGAVVFSGSLLGAGSTSTLISLPAGGYRFAVRACSGGFDADQCGAYGFVGFTVNPAGPSVAPTVTFPAQGATLTSSTQTLSWTAVTPNPALSGLTYEVLLRDLALGTTTLQITVPSPTLSTIFTMPSSSQYELKVRACQASCGPFSTAVTFAVVLPAKPTVAPAISNCTVSGGNSLTCNWGAVSNADAYQVQVVQAPPAGPGGGALTVAAIQVSATTVTLPVPPGAATVFLAACNGDGCGPNATSGIVAGGSNPSQPNIGTPMAGTVVNGPSVLFTWNRVPGDTGSTLYRLFVQDLSRQATALDVFTSNNFYSAQFKAEGARYDALVVANPGLAGAVTGPAQGFNVAGLSSTAPTLVSPTHNSALGSGNIELGWSPVPGATLYEYFVAVLGQGSASARGVTPGLLAQVPLTGTGAGTVYSGIVRACPTGATCVSGSDLGWGPWSNAAGGPGVTNFTVVP